MPKHSGRRRVRLRLAQRLEYADVPVFPDVVPAEAPAVHGHVHAGRQRLHEAQRAAQVKQAVGAAEDINAAGWKGVPSAVGAAGGVYAGGGGPGSGATGPNGAGGSTGAVGRIDPAGSTGAVGSDGAGGWREEFPSRPTASQRVLLAVG